MEASKLRELRDLANSLPDPRLGVIIRKGDFVQLLDYVSRLEERNSDLMYECSALHEERRVWWTGDKRTEPTMSEDVATALRDLKEVLGPVQPADFDTTARSRQGKG